MVVVKETAPISKDEVVARMEYSKGEELLGSVDIVAAESVEQEKYHNALEKLFRQFINIY